MFKSTVRIKPQKILDSKKRPTLAVELILGKKRIWSAVPAGTSAGRFEAKPVKVEKAIKNINLIIAPLFKNWDLTQQEKIDQFLIKLDGTKNKSRLGANTLLAVSLAVCRAGAALKKLPLYQYIQLLYQGKKTKLPKPCFNIINGGAHAENGLDFQEFLLAPQSQSFQENLKIGIKVYQQLKKILLDKFGSIAIKLGAEGGFMPPIKQPEQAIELILIAVKKAGIKEKIKIALDVAASQFYQRGYYQTKFGKFDVDSLINYYLSLIKKYPIISVEDPFAEHDWSAWSKLKKKTNILIIGDDLTVTNPQRIRLAQQKKACSGVIIKPNQIGTVSEVLEAVRLARSFGWRIMVSHRSGETLDDFIADLAVGLGADFIKSGAPYPPERMIKYQRLVQIENKLNI
ncbi:MAG: phosphopyruvate hydratase [Minisyncoccales bacterium]